MATSNSRFDDLIKPGEVLGFFMTATLLAGLAVLICQLLPGGDNDLWRIQPSNRMTLLAAWVALIATLGAAKAAVTSMVRQHTVNTLLQSRLSETFMKYGEQVNRGIENFKEAGGVKGPAHTYIDREALRYMLNYYEYIAAGVRIGDLSEDMLRAMMRGIVCRMTEIFGIYIRDVRERNPHAYEHLMWLSDKWAAEIESEKKHGTRH